MSVKSYNVPAVYREINLTPWSTFNFIKLSGRALFSMRTSIYILNNFDSVTSGKSESNRRPASKDFYVAVAWSECFDFWGGWPSYTPGDSVDGTFAWSGNSSERQNDKKSIHRGVAATLYRQGHHWQECLYFMLRNFSTIWSIKILSQAISHGFLYRYSGSAQLNLI